MTTAIATLTEMMLGENPLGDASRPGLPRLFVSRCTFRALEKAVLEPRELSFQPMMLFTLWRQHSCAKSYELDCHWFDVPMRTSDGKFVRAVLRADAPKHELEFEQIFGLGAHCDGFQSGMCVAVLSDSETCHGISKV